MKITWLLTSKHNSLPKQLLLPQDGRAANTTAAFSWVGKEGACVDYKLLRFILATEDGAGGGRRAGVRVTGD